VSAGLSSELKKKIAEVVARYPKKEAAILPVLHLIQRETGAIGAEEELWVAGLLEIRPIKVREVVTFYTMYHQRPVGRYHIQACSNLTCSLMGGEKLIDHLQKRLGIKIGETTADQRFTLSEVECLGACEQAPCLMINFDYYGLLDPEKIDALLEGLD
jgi:NADH-quinone oxidoreductase subunit E